MLERVSKRRQVETTVSVSSMKKMLLFEKSPLDESLRWTENLALLENIGVKVHQGREKKFDEVIDCMVNF